MAERRQYARIKIRLPIELLPDSTTTPLRGETSDLSLGGCYVESLFPLPIGTTVEIRLRVGDSLQIVAGSVATCDHQVGNGIRFLKMLPEDREELTKFLAAAAEDSHRSPVEVPAPVLDAEPERLAWPGVTPSGCACREHHE